MVEMNAPTMREMTVPRFALRRDEVAVSLGISVSTLNTWIDKGRVPKGKKVDGVVLWDTDRVREAARRIFEDPLELEDGLEWGDDPA